MKIESQQLVPGGWKLAVGNGRLEMICRRVSLRLVNTDGAFNGIPYFCPALSDTCIL